jgi:hypothetical protein
MDDEISERFWTAADSDLPRYGIKTSKPRNAISKTIAKVARTTTKATDTIREGNESVGCIANILMKMRTDVMSCEVITTTTLSERTFDEGLRFIGVKAKESQSRNQRTSYTSWADNVVAEHTGRKTRRISVFIKTHNILNG